MVMLSFWLEGKINEKIWRGFATSDRVDRVDWASRVEVVDGQRRHHGATLEKSPSPRFVSPSRGLPMHFLSLSLRLCHYYALFLPFCTSFASLPFLWLNVTWRKSSRKGNTLTKSCIQFLYNSSPISHRVSPNA